MQAFLPIEPRIFDWFDLDEMENAVNNLDRGLNAHQHLQLLCIIHKIKHGRNK